MSSVVTALPAGRITGGAEGVVEPVDGDLHHLSHGLVFWARHRLEDGRVKGQRRRSDGRSHSEARLTLVSGSMNAVTPSTVTLRLEPSLKLTQSSPNMSLENTADVVGGAAPPVPDSAALPPPLVQLKVATRACWFECGAGRVELQEAELRPASTRLSPQAE